jgi:inner membrane transporter RhtA
VRKRSARPSARGSDYGPAVPPVVLVIVAIGSVQFGAALAKTLFDDVGPGGTVLLRMVFAALVLLALWRPGLRGLRRRDLWLVAAFGISLAGMNGFFYAALDRIPQGVAVTFEMVGPLSVAVFGSRNARDALWAILAIAGILLLSDFGRLGGLDATGVALALLAGGFWGIYILLSARVGRAFPGGQGLALALAAASVPLVPVGVADGGGSLLEPQVLAIGFAVAMLSTAIPYSLELEALRRLRAGVFGVMMSLEPAMGALAGYVVGGETLGARELAAIGLVVAASAGAASSAPELATPFDA